MNRLRIGVLGLQGAIEEHVSMIEKAMGLMDLEGEAWWLKKSWEIENVHGLIIPGGESTVMGRLSTYNKTLRAIKLLGNAGIPMFGTCSGMVMLAQRVHDRIVGETRQPTSRLMDISVERNAFGRQKESFEADLDVPVLGETKFRGVFIRAPIVRETGQNVKVLCKLNREIVSVQQGNLMATAFHPELTGDTRFHEYFLKFVLQYTQSQRLTEQQS